jgi:hypothetical protein
VRLFDVESGREQGWFYGPDGTLIFDEHLLSISHDQGTAAWDLADGARVWHDPAFTPLGYHPGSREFLIVFADGTAQASRLCQGD